MLILEFLFGRKKNKTLSEERQKELALSLLQEAKTLALKNPKKAIALLEKKGKDVYSVLRLGGVMNRELCDLVEKIYASLGENYYIPSLTVEILFWGSNWRESTTMKDLLEKTQSTEADILYCTLPPEQNSHRNAIAELEALQLFSVPDTAMVVIGEEDILFRRSFILRAGPLLPPDSEEIGQDMSDQATALGLKVYYVHA